MPVVFQQAPYDSLETVTQLTRTVLADYIQGIQPNVQGVVNTNGVNVTLVSGSAFSYLLNGLGIVINNSQYVVSQVTSSTTLTLQSSAGTQAGVTYGALLPTGDIFADSQAYVLPTINLGWRRVQKKLAEKGHPRFQNEVVLSGIPATTNTDPASQQFISWSEFFDGTAVQNTPTLPLDFVSPLKIWERTSGFSVLFREMKPAGDGLWPRNKGSYNYFFDWREDAIYVPGSLFPSDWRLRYATYLGDIAVTQNSFALTPVPIMRCADALAYYAAAIFVEPRGGALLAPSYMQKGDEALEQIPNSWSKLQQRSSFHRKSWGWRGRRGIVGTF